MNVYDFDKTIFKYDSTTMFYFYCLKRHNRIHLQGPTLLSSFLKFYLFKKGTKTEFKETMYNFVKEINYRKDVQDFWKQNKRNLKKWYLKQRKDTDVIISASPEFLLKPICDELNVNLICSKVSPITGNYDGINCHGEEKVRRFRELYPDAEIDNFYSDSYSDTPLAKLAKCAYIVKGDEIIPWNFNR